MPAAQDRYTVQGQPPLCISSQEGHGCVLYKSKMGVTNTALYKSNKGDTAQKSRPEASGRQIWKSEKKQDGERSPARIKKESSRQPTGCMSRGSEDESLTANTEHTAFLCLYYHIPQIKSTDFKRSQKIRRRRRWRMLPQAGIPPCEGRSNRQVRRSERSPKQKLSRCERNPAAGILRANGRHRFFGLLSALVPLLRNGANRRVLHLPGKVTKTKIEQM